MDEAPEIEVFCGGINSKTATAAAFWRQGNLLHFGFDLSPDEMNTSGKEMLENAIAYIARFTDDRPIMVSPIPLCGPRVPDPKTDPDPDRSKGPELVGLPGE